ncbi:hypothetical protein PF004_g22597 [Phytophthora fragariae]|uniref:Uncharacterized protein n=1 Tax=Phytophthora fragariae TaxID=53985 RepID=A0A6G0N0K0_9STRA|nr:hypothetical protein PF003_g37706 [Phytophthora fragariae]KAE9188126.1 hypothetical protein PF004_g22597 [Phytophthora fragariae]
MMLKSVPFAPPAWASALRRPPAQKLRLGHFPTPIMPFSPPGLPEGVRMFIKRDDFSGMESTSQSAAEPADQSPDRDEDLREPVKLAPLPWVGSPSY